MLRIPSDRVWSRQTSRHPSGHLRASLNAGLYSRPERTHRPGSRLSRRKVEEHAWFEAGLANMCHRGVDVVEGIYTPQSLRNPRRPTPLSRRILDAVGLRIEGPRQKLEYAHILAHKMTGEEPVVCFNQRMKEVPVALDAATWAEATRGPANLLPLQKGDHELFDDQQAAPVPAQGAVHAYILSMEKALANELVADGDQAGSWQPKESLWELDVGAILAQVASPLPFHVEGQGWKSVDTYLYDWWYLPADECDVLTTEGYFFPGEDMTVERLTRPPQGWVVPLVFGGRTRPSIRSMGRPTRVITRFLWVMSEREDGGDPLRMSGDAAERSLELEYLANLFCVEDWRSFAAELRRNRPSSVPSFSSHDGETSARLDFIKANPSRSAGRRVFPTARAPPEMTHRGATQGGPRSGGAGPRGTAGPSQQQAAAHVSASRRPSNTRASSSASSSSSSATSTSSAATATLSVASTLIADFDGAHEEIMRFLDECLDARSLVLRDLLGGWPQIAKRLTGDALQQAQRLLETKASLGEELMRLIQQEEGEDIFEAYGDGARSPAQELQRPLADSPICSASPGSNGSDAASQSPISSTASE